MSTRFLILKNMVRLEEFKRKNYSEKVIKKQERKIEKLKKKQNIELTTLNLIG